MKKSCEFRNILSLLTIRLFCQNYHFGTKIAKEKIFLQLTLFNTQTIARMKKAFYICSVGNDKDNV